MIPEMERGDVHTEHCCVAHGCKYGRDEECTVATGRLEQSFPCEQCGDDERHLIEEMDEHLSPFLAWLKERGLEICEIGEAEESRDVVAGSAVLVWDPVSSRGCDVLAEYRAHRESRRGEIPRRKI